MSDRKKENQSIVFKLNAWHLSQVFFSFLWINLLLIFLFMGSLFYNAEQVITERADNVSVTVSILDRNPDGFRVPGFMNGLFPEHMKGAVRQLHVNSTEGNLTFWKRIPHYKYRVWVPIPEKETYFALDYDIGTSLHIFRNLFLVLAAFQLLFFLSNIGKGAKAMRRALQPLSDLARTARSINQTKIIQPDAQLRDLTGTIDTINVMQLDRRLKISSEDSELKELTGAINGMLERIDSAYRSQVRFVSDASHELRTPISVIQGYANLLDRWGKKDEKALQESIDAIKGEAESMKDLVESLLFLARGDNETMRLNLETINLSEMTEEIVRQTSMIDESHEFITKIKDSISTLGDAQLIKQAIRIFVDNSVKYTPLGGTVTVSAFMEGNIPKISVQDSGIGIPSEDLPHVFDRFFRSDDSRTRKTGGTGLGLSIARWILDRHSAEVEVLSREDLGTRITISFQSNKTQAANVDIE